VTVTRDDPLHWEIRVEKKHLKNLLLSIFTVVIYLQNLETGAKKAVSQGVMAILLDMFQEWHKTDHRNRHLALRKSILSVIKVCIGFGEFSVFVLFVFEL